MRNEILTFGLSAALLGLGTSPAVTAQEIINPYRQPLMGQVTAVEWNFDADLGGWQAANDCRIEHAAGALKLSQTGIDPYIISPLFNTTGPAFVKVRIRTATAGTCQIFWNRDGSDGFSEKLSQSFDLSPDGHWHDYSIEIRDAGALRQLRVDPGRGEANIDMDSLRIERAVIHPVEIAAVRMGEQAIEATIRNHGDQAISVTAAGQSYNLPAQGTTQITLPVSAGKKAFEVVAVTVTPEELPAVSRPTVVYNPKGKADWVRLSDGRLALEVAADGSGARVLRNGELVALVAPLAWSDGRVPELKAVRKGKSVRLSGPGIESFELSLTGEELTYRLDATIAMEGPVVRVVGGMEQGLLAGVEYLGKGERSSSTLDLEGPEHIRYAPDLMDLTMPLMAFVTERATVAMLWSDTGLQPTFATPNFFDGTADHRMSLRGRKIEAVIRVSAGWAEGKRLEDAVLWAVNRRGLPELPAPPRSRDEQWKLCLAALEGSLHNEDGWGHCVEANWKRQFFSEHASSIFRLTGKLPELPRLTRGGAHVRNDAAYLLSGRAQEWLDTLRRQAEHEMGWQKPDGSYHYDGPYRRGHYEDTASGLCARPAYVLLEYAYYAGDRKALDAGLRTLEYMKRFRDPRGAQTWECPLHSPDILASANLVLAYVRGYELTGKREYLDLAVRWAVSGVPFVYQWGNRPIMPYATIAVYCATNWRAPVWIGLPVQWCGTVYAYGLLQLAAYDKTLDWKKLAEGILISAEQQQYPDGPHAGTLPDSFVLESQHRNPPDINPCALVSLRLLVSGELDSVAVATDGKHRVVAPFPVTIRDGRAHIEGKPGLKYQIVIDGQRVVDVQSSGGDVVPLE